MDGIMREKKWQIFSFQWYSSDDKWNYGISRMETFYIKKTLLQLQIVEEN